MHLYLRTILPVSFTYRNLDGRSEVSSSLIIIANTSCVFTICLTLFYVYHMYQLILFSQTLYNIDTITDEETETQRI